MGEFSLQVLVGGNVILVQSSGREPEMFVPAIVNNRITLQNVIEHRRCCKLNSSNVSRSSDETTKNPCRMSIQQLPPLANSTPERYSQSFRRYPTPEVVRRAAVQSRNTSVSIPGLPPGLKVVRLHRNPTANTPKKLAKIVPTTHSPLAIDHSRRSRSQSQVLRNLLNVSTFRTPPSLHTTANTIPPESPNQSFLMRRVLDKTPGSATKWRKCLTPQRTYIRRVSGKKTPVKLKRMSVQPLSLHSNGSLIPDFQLNPTKYPIGDGPIIVKRRKLVIDSKVAISPRTFKLQLKHTEDLRRSNFELPKRRRQFIDSQLTAFDLLTNSGYYPRISKKLNSVFRKGCLNKHAETILKYQMLTMNIPTIETP